MTLTLWFVLLNLTYEPILIALQYAECARGQQRFYSKAGCRQEGADRTKSNGKGPNDKEPEKPAIRIVRKG